MRFQPNPAYSSFFISILCLLDHWGVLPHFAGTLLAIQFLVIHSSAFMGSVRLIENEKLRNLAFGSLIVLYSLFAFKTDGLFGIVQFWGLTYANYHHFIFTKAFDEDKASLVVRWATAFFLFMLAVGFFDTPGDVDEWAGNRRAGLAAIWYFIGLGAVEMSGFYESGWRRLAAALIKKLTGSSNQPLPPWLVKIAEQENGKPEGSVYGTGPASGGKKPTPTDRP